MARIGVGVPRRTGRIPGDRPGLAFWGGVGVQRKITRAERQRLKANEPG